MILHKLTRILKHFSYGKKQKDKTLLRPKSTYFAQNWHMFQEEFLGIYRIWGSE